MREREAHREGGGKMKQRRYGHKPRKADSHQKLKKVSDGLSLRDSRSVVC